MKYKVTLNGKTYEVEVEVGKVVLLDEYEACAPAPAAAPAATAAPALHQQHRQHRQLLQHRLRLLCLMANQ